MVLPENKIEYRREVNSIINFLQERGLDKVARYIRAKTDLSKDESWSFEKIHNLMIEVYRLKYFIETLDVLDKALK